MYTFVYIQHQHTTTMEKQIKQALTILLKDSIYAKANRLEERVETLFNIHKTWITFAQVTHTPEQMAIKLFAYDQNLKVSSSGNYLILADKYRKQQQQ